MKFKGYILRFTGLLVLLIALNVIYTVFFWQMQLRDVCEHVAVMREAQDTTDIYYFAESSNWNAQYSDSTYLSISELTNLFYPSLKVHAVNQSASHSGMYKYWLRHFDPARKKPGAIVVTLNLRSFNAQWRHSKLETPLQQSLVLLKPYPKLLNRAALTFNLYDDKPEEAREKQMLDEWASAKLEFPFDFKYSTVKMWDSAMGNGGYKNPDGSWDFPKIQLACHNIKAFAFNLRESNQRVKDFDEIASWCRENRVPLFLNLMAENVEYADRLVGKELVFLMRQNRDFLVNRYNKDGCVVVDNLEKVKGMHFTDQTWTTEHYSYKGRMIVARNLAEQLSSIFKDNYKKAY